MKVIPGEPGSVLMLAYYFPPQSASGAARPQRFFKYLPRFGYSAAVVSFGGSVEEENAGFGLPGIVYRVTRILQGVSRRYDYRLPWLTTALAQAEEIMSTHPVRVVFSTHPPVATHLVAARLKRKYRIRWIADFRDPLFGNSVFKARRYTIWCDRVMERSILKNCDVAIANTEPLADLWRKRYPQWASKIVTIWNGFDPEETLTALPLPPRPYRLLSHVGELYGARKPTLLLESLARLLDSGRLRDDTLRIRFVGPREDSGSAGLLEKLRQRGVVDCHDAMLPRTDANREAAQSDYLLLLDLTGLERNIQVPAKIFDYLRIGRPILAFTTRGSPAEWILGLSGVPHECIYITDPSEEIEEKLLKFFTIPSDPRHYSPQFRDLFDGLAQTRQLAALMHAASPDPK